MGLSSEGGLLPSGAGARLVYVRRSIPLAGKEEAEREQAEAGREKLHARRGHGVHDSGRFDGAPAPSR
jgi:hypothetical protein